MTSDVAMTSSFSLKTNTKPFSLPYSPVFVIGNTVVYAVLPIDHTTTRPEQMKRCEFFQSVRTQFNIASSGGDFHAARVPSTSSSFFPSSTVETVPLEPIVNFLANPPAASFSTVPLTVPPSKEGSSPCSTFQAKSFPLQGLAVQRLELATVDKVSQPSGAMFLSACPPTFSKSIDFNFFVPWKPFARLSCLPVSPRTVLPISSGLPCAELRDMEPRMRRVLEKSMEEVSCSFEEQIELAKKLSLE